jgi:ubiquinone/menaquinone biosynthesis C-methylase UbiE
MKAHSQSQASAPDRWRSQRDRPFNFCYYDSLMLTPDRIYEEELLDAGAGTDEDVVRNLSDLRRVNRWLGGNRIIFAALKSEMKIGDRHVTILDVGTGSADIPDAVTRWCERRRIVATTTAVDVSWRNLRLARARFSIPESVQFVQADSLALPFSGKTFDYVTASMFLHHFRDEDVVRLLSAFAKLARRAVVVNDLVRNLVPYYFTRLAGRLVATSYLTRNDAPVSVLRGFTVEDLKRHAGCAGLTEFRVQRMFPYRILLIARTNESD